MKILRLIFVGLPHVALWIISELADDLAALFDGVAWLAQRAAAWLEEKGR